MNPIREFFKTYWMAILTGLLVGTSYIPFPPWALFFCYTPLWYWALKKPESNWKQVFWGGWISQVILSVIGFHWIAYVTKEFGFLPWPVALLVLLLFAATVHLYIPLTLVLGHFLRRKCNLGPLSLIILYSCLMALSEIHWPSLFSWNLGYPFLWIKSPVAQTADIWGFQGLSFLVYVTNGILASLFLGITKQQRILAVSSLLLFWGTLHFSGIQRKASVDEGQESLSVLQIQANVGNLEKFFAEKGMGFQEEILNRYFSLTRGLVAQYPETQLIIWPETAFPDVLNEHALWRPFSRRLVEFVKEINRPLITGGFGQSGPHEIPKGSFNSLFLFGADGKPMDKPYNKTELLAFGEYVPFGNLFPILKKINPGGPGWDFGSGPQVFNFGELKVGVQVCYESLDPAFSTSLKKHGAHFIVNVTNDSWFGQGFEPYQHAIMTLARAVEVRLPLLRTTNTGITTGISARGDLMKFSPQFEPWGDLYKIQINRKQPTTFYSRFGSWLTAVFILLILVILWRARKSEFTN